jgi:hypothetical protein
MRDQQSQTDTESHQKADDLIIGWTRFLFAGRAWQKVFGDFKRIVIGFGT